MCLFAGRGSDSGFGSYLHKEFRKVGLGVLVDEIDILRNKTQHNMLKKVKRQRLLTKLQSGMYCALVSVPTVLDIFAFQVFRVAGPTAIEIQKMAKRFPMVGATGSAECERRKHPDQFHGAGDTSTIGHIESIFYPRASRRLGETENRGRPSIYLAVEKYPRSGRAERGKDRSIAAVRLGTDYQKPTRLLARWPGVEEVLATGWPILDSDNRYQGPLNRQKNSKEMMVGRNKGVFQTAVTTAWPAALCEVLARNLVAELLKTASASRAQEKGESRGRKRRRIEDDHHDQDRSKGKKAVGDRRKISSEEMAKVRSGEALGDDLVYVGRVRPSKDPVSKWANPFRMKRDGNREEVIRKYKAYFEQGSIGADVEELRGKTLLCHCDRDQACHADVLLNALRDTQKEGPESGGFFYGSTREEASLVEFIDDGLPTKLVVKEDVKEAASDESREGWRGVGAPRRAHYMGRDKPYADGGGTLLSRKVAQSIEEVAWRFCGGAPGPGKEGLSSSGEGGIRRDRWSA